MEKASKISLGLVAAFLVLTLAGEATGQIFQRRIVRSNCPGGSCPVVVQSQPVNVVQANQPAVALPADEAEKLTLPADVEEVSSAVADGPHCRCLVSGSCGSGTICGADSSGAYVVSNAHVWGTQIGKVVTIDCVSGGATKRLQGRIVFSGYSNSRMVDFAIAKVVGLTSKVYMPMLRTEPSDAPYGTRGSPRCVWPQVTKPFDNPRNYGQGLITGTPDAIGGQSGSAIYNSKGQQIALLTWSINGRCAGQKTSLLWQVATQRNVMLADERTAELRELNDSPNRPETVEGIHGDFSGVTACHRPDTCEGIHGGLAVFERSGDEADLVGRRVRPVTENVIASQASMQDLPIWFESKPVDPPVDPKPNCHELSDKEWELIQFLRKQSEKEAGFGDRRQQKDWVALLIKFLPLILEIIEEFQKGKA